MKTAQNFNEKKIPLVFARVNVNRYDILGFKIEEIPTVYLFQKGAKETFVEYEGDEKVSSFTEFLEKQIGTNPKTDL